MKLGVCCVLSIIVIIADLTLEPVHHIFFAMRTGQAVNLPNAHGRGDVNFSEAISEQIQSDEVQPQFFEFGYYRRDELVFLC